MLLWCDCGRGGGINFDGIMVLLVVDDGVVLFLGFGEWEDVLGILLCVVV